jgi:hypothetical protein
MSLKETNPSKAETEYPVPIRATKRGRMETCRT